MPIRVQCSNCSKVYNLADENAGKRLRCKQCAVVFQVPAAPPPPAPLAKQKICVGCGMDVAGQPRTKDQLGNYYCRPCYAEYARRHAAMASAPAELQTVGAPARGGAGGGGDDAEVIDLAALDPLEQMDQDSLPPPPPIPGAVDDVRVYEEPVGYQVPVPKLKKKKKKKKAAIAASAGGDSFTSKLGAMPVMLSIAIVCALFFGLGFLSTTMAFLAAVGLVLVGIGVWLWGEIGLLMLAFAESVGNGLLFMFFPPYRFRFLRENWSQTAAPFGRCVLGGVIVVGAVVLSRRVADRAVAALNELETELTPVLEDVSSDPAYVIHVDLSGGYEKERAMQRRIAARILDSFKQRGVKPGEGKYMVKATVQRSIDENNKISIRVKGNKMKLPAPKLVCTLSVQDANNNTVYEQSRDSLTEPGALNIDLTSDSENSPDLEKELWKNVLTEFQTLADGVPVPGKSATPAAGAASAAPAGASGATPAPADAPK